MLQAGNLPSKIRKKSAYSVFKSKFLSSEAGIFAIFCYIQLLNSAVSIRVHILNFPVYKIIAILE